MSWSTDLALSMIPFYLGFANASQIAADSDFLLAQIRFCKNK